MAATTTRRASRFVLVLVVPIVALIAASTTRWIEGPSVTNATTGGAQTIVIKNFSFRPGELEVPSGTEVLVTNADQTPHTLSSRNDSFDAGEIGAESSATINVEQPGTYAYYCKIHATMTGTLVVK